MALNVTVTSPPIFNLDWCRDAQGYRVVRTANELRELQNRYERSPSRPATNPDTGRPTKRMVADWPEHWPAWSGELMRWAAGSEVEGGGLIWPTSDEADSFRPLDEGAELIEQFFVTAHQSPDDCSDVLRFADRYGLLWSDQPVTVELFRYIRDEFVTLAEEIAKFRDRKDQLTSSDYRTSVEKLASHLGHHSPKFTLELRHRTGHRGLIPQLVPQDLYSAIALKLTETAHGGGAEWRRCQYEGCGRLFLAGMGGSRGHRALCCSDTCTQKHHDSKRRHEGESAAPVIADEPCPYCGGPIHLTSRKRTTEHCGSDRCKNLHSRAKRKARTARTEGGK